MTMPTANASANTISDETSAPPARRRRDHDVLIAGGGPTGMLLAAELALAGVDVAVVEPHADRAFTGSRALGLKARTLELFEQRGVAARFVAEGTPSLHLHFMGQLDMGGQPTRFNFFLALKQVDAERILAGWVETLPVAFHRGRTVTGFAQDAHGVDVALSDGATLRAAYLVGCDGGRSTVRKASGIAFPGWDASTSWINAEVHVAQAPAFGFHFDAAGRRHAIGPVEGDRVRMVLMDPTPVADRDPTLDDLKSALVDAYGTDFGVHDPLWLSRFTDATRQAAAYRDRRVLLAGDAAHVHAPFGGQGMELGLQDAMNLGWKLAQVVDGASPDALLDTYHAERHPVAARALRITMATGALLRTDPRSLAASELVQEIAALDAPRRRLAAELSFLAIRHDLGEGHPLLGRRMPDLDIATAAGRTNVYTLMHDAKPLLLRFDRRNGVDATAADGPCVKCMPPAPVRGNCPRSGRSIHRTRCWCGPTATSRGWGRAATTDSQKRSHAGAGRRAWPEHHRVMPIRRVREAGSRRSPGRR